jgi:3-dehydroquinate synthase
LLNFGHTFGHAIEHCLGYGEWLHGEAVAAGMVMAASLSNIPPEDTARLAALLAQAGLPTAPPRIGAAKMLDAMGMDKKVLHKQLRFVLLKSLGEAYLSTDYDMQKLKRVLEAAD